MNTSTIAAWIPGLVSILGSGPWGLFGGLLAIGGALGGIYYLVRKANRLIDNRDLESGGADAGKTAVDMRNQLDKLRKEHEAEWDKFQKGE